MVVHDHTDRELPRADATLIGEMLRASEHLTDVGVPAALFDLAGTVGSGAVVCAFTAQRWVMRPTTSLEVRDAVWRHIIDQVRTEAGDWSCYAVAAQYYALKSIAVRLAPKRLSRAKIRRANEETVSEFLITCDRIQTPAPHVGARLVNQTRYHATKAYLDRERHAHLYDPLEAEATGNIGDLRLRQPPPGHPDFVLIRLIIDTAPPPRPTDPPLPADSRIVGNRRRRSGPAPAASRRREGLQLKAIDAELVARTRLERHWPPGSTHGLRKTIDQAAAEVDKIEGGETGKKRRKRAEAIIIRELSAHLPASKRGQVPGSGVTADLSSCAG
ncbi:hypothetical protein [Actinoplanes sp. NPDC051851]|uniref:hypothetical protein n=1 Tax=Actinoplanes sp. NPDC051851 TaxID=3154753 RepID=UPI0034491FCE